MDGSPATRLPETDSLPDGFVESSGVDMASPPSSAPVDDPPHAALDLDRPGATNRSGGETLGDPSLSAPAVEDASSVAAGAAEALGTLSLDVSPEPERALGEHGPAGAARDAKKSLKENYAAEQAGTPTAQKESGEPKRKVVKRSKLEKERELFELAQQYHKVVAERDAAIAVKEKLESLCREFQHQNKLLKEECRRVSTEGQNMRMELSDKFNNAIKDVSVKLEEQKNECIAQLEENNLLRSKLKDLADQYNITQQKYAHELKEKMLELELADLKLQQHQEKAAQEHKQIQLYAEQVSQLMTTEKNLRLQLASDGERFQHFQAAATRLRPSVCTPGGRAAKANVESVKDPIFSFPNAMAAAMEEPPGDDGSPPPVPLYFFGTPWPEFNQGLSYIDTFRCAGADAGAAATLIEFYSTNYKSSAPLPGWIKRIRNGQITVDGVAVTDPNLTLRDGSKMVYHRLPWQEPFAPYLLEVLYEDDDMVALNKPSGLQVLPKGLFQQRTVLAQLQLRDWNMTSSCSSRRKDMHSHPVPVHRLGRGTSGLLLCAKTKVAKVQLASYFAEGAINAANKRDKSEFGEERKISKFYRALVTGILDDDEVVVTQPIGLVHYPGVAEGLYAAYSSGKQAMSKVYVLERLAHQNHTLVQVEIHSGRPHQIRIHLAYIGHPLVDDPLYGIGGHPKFVEPESTGPESSFAHDGGYERPSQPVPGDCGYHLHAHWLVLCHPTTNKVVKITAPLPPILQTREERSATDEQLDC